MFIGYKMIEKDYKTNKLSLLIFKNIFDDFKPLKAAALVDQFKQ